MPFPTRCIRGLGRIGRKILDFPSSVNASTRRSARPATTLWRLLFAATMNDDRTRSLSIIFDCADPAPEDRRSSRIIQKRSPLLRPYEMVCTMTLAVWSACAVRLVAKPQSRWLIPPFCSPTRTNRSPVALRAADAPPEKLFSPELLHSVPMPRIIPPKSRQALACDDCSLENFYDLPRLAVKLSEEYRTEVR